MSPGKPIREWRVRAAEDTVGLLVWFDPFTERLELRDLREDELIDTLDKLGSVSALSPSRRTVDNQMDAFDPLPNLGEDLPF